MQRNLLTNAKKYIQRNRKHRTWRKVVRVMACCVVFCTVYALIMPALTMEQETFCGYEEHTHSEECYVKISDSKELICSLDEEQQHVHSESCLDADGNTVCGLEECAEHIHTDDCFETVEEPLTCQLEENEEHTHSALCYGTWELACSLEEHIHEKACFFNPEADAAMYTYSDDDIHVEVQLPQDTTVPADAELKVTPIESTDDGYDTYVEQAEEAVDGSVANIALYDISFYTADGTYYPVDDTAKVVMNFAESPVDAAADVQVLHYDDNDKNPVLLEEVTVSEEEMEAKRNLITLFTGEKTEVQTVVEFKTEGFSTFAVIELTSMYQTVEGITGLEGKSYIIAAVNNDTGNNADGTPTTLAVMTSEAADNNNRLTTIRTNSFEYIDNKITSVALTDYTNAVWTFEKAGTDTYYIKSSGGQYLSIPSNERLTLSGDKQEFRVVPATNLNAENGDVTNAVCIETVDRDYRVVLPNSDPFGQNFTSYTHGTDNRETHLVLVEYEPKIPDLTNLADKSYIIAGVNFEGNYGNDVLPVLTSNTSVKDNHLASRQTEEVVFQDNKVISVSLSNYADAVWTFVAADDGTYYIKNSEEQYLSIPSSAYLTVGNTPQKFSVVAAEVSNGGDATNAVCIRAENGFYVNIVGNSLYNVGNDEGAFTGYNPDGGTGARGNHLVLIEYTEHQIEMPVISDDDDSLNNLDGKKLVITNIGGYAITGTAFNADNNNNGINDDHLAEQQVTIANGQSTVTISSENSADLVWEFEAAETAGQYYIKHVATGKYLHIYDAYQDGNKPLTLTDADDVENKQAIEVLSANDNNNPNAVWFRFPELLYTDEYDNDPNNNNDYNAIDRYGGGFAVYNKGSADTQNKFLLSEYTDLPMMDAIDPTVAANNLNGKTMVITAANYNAAMSNSTTIINNRGMLEAQATEEKGDVLGVVAGTNLADVSWTFTSVPDGQANQYYIQDSTGKYLNINGTSVALSPDNRQPISVYENNDGTFVLYVNQNNQDYLLDYGWNDKAISAWNRDHTGPDGNNKFKLTPVEQFDLESKVVTNLAGKTLALVSIYDANVGDDGNYTTPQLALTSQIYYDGLKGVKVDLSSNTGKVYTFDDDQFTNNQELWTFEAAGDKLGVYYIKAANEGYLNLGDGTAAVSNTPQEITVLSDTYKGIDGITYEVVYLRATVDGNDVYLRREFNGNDSKLFGDDELDEDGKKISERNFVLAQPCTIKIDVYKWIDTENEDWLFKPHFGDDLNSTLKEEYIEDGGTLPTSRELGAEPEENTRTIETQHFVSFNFGESWDPYTAGKGRDFPQAYMASWAPELDALDGTKDGYIDRSKITDKNAFIETLKEAVYDEDFEGESPYWGVEYELTHYEVTLPDGSTLKDDDGNVVKFAPGTSYKLNEDGTIGITDVNRIEYSVPSGSTFKAQYTEFSDILTFYINLYGVVEDVAADIQPRYIEDFTLGLAIAHIYYPGKYAGDTTEDYNKSNEYINSLFKGKYGENVEPGVMHAVIDGFITRKDTQDLVDGEYIPEYRGSDNLNSKDEKIQRYLSNSMTPALGASATALAAHVLDYVRTVPDINIMLKNYVAGNNEDTPTLNNQTIDTATFEVRWYVVKDQGDSWHIDGVTIGKTEPIPVTKAFYGLEEADVKNRVSYERNNNAKISGETDYINTGNYQIGVSINGGDDGFVNYYKMQPYDQDDWDKEFQYDAKDNDGKDIVETCQDPNLNPAIDNLYTYNGGSNPYNWTMSAILEQHYKLDEENYDFDGYDRVSKVTVNNKDGSSTDSFDTSAKVTGGTTASVEFNNYYTKTGTGMFIIKKLSSVTGLPLAGAEFTLTKDDGTVTTETTDADGEAAFYNLKEGTYTLEETIAPDGFAASQTTWSIAVDSDGTVTCGNQTLYKVKKVPKDDDVVEVEVINFNPLEVKNAPATTTVKVIKQFVGISKDQVDSLAEGYSILMKPTDNGNDKTYTLKLTKNYDATPVVSADGLTYTWTLTDVPEIGYTVTESQFKLKNYVTTVSVEGFKDGDYTTEVTNPVVANNTATFTATFDEKHEDGFTIYNSYANDFSIQITKVDSADNTKALSGATFDVYGPHFISTSSERVEVAGQTLYYLGTVTTDGYGITTFNGWYTGDGEQQVFHKLQLGYSYALVETKAPDGYNQLTEPIYLGKITSEGVGDLDLSKNPNISFSNGVYSITVENQPGYELPKSGGTGTYQYIIGGLLLLAAAAILLYNHTKRGKEEHASF